MSMKRANKDSAIDAVYTVKNIPETKEERDLRLGYDLFIQYDTNIKKGIKNKHYSKEETDLIILAIGDRFKPIKDYRTR